MPLLSLLQLISPTLPLGAYNYSEGLEYLIETEEILSPESLQTWLAMELRYGSIRVETSVMLRVYGAIASGNDQEILVWQRWLQANRETKELRQQSLQMGLSLLNLLPILLPESQQKIESLQQLLHHQCHYAIAFGIAAYLGEIERETAVTGYLHSWVNNLIGAGVKLIPLGQTAGQKILTELHEIIPEVTAELLLVLPEHLSACTWGLSLASMNHEVQYTRLFRS